MPQRAIVAFRSHDAAGVAYVNTLAVSKDVPGAPDADVTPQQFVDDVWTWLGTEYRAMLAPQYTVDELHALGVLGSVFESTHSVSAAGTLSLASTTTESLPRELCLVLTLKTATPGRSGRGRMFIPSARWVGFNADTNNWAQTGAYWTNVGAFGAKLLAGQDVTHGVLVHHYAARVYSRKDATMRDLIAYVRRPQYHWLRSRATAP